PTETAIPTDTPTPSPIALPFSEPLPPIANTPVVTSPLPQPSPMPLVEQPAGTVNILLLGMDRTAGQGVARTDVMVIASIFPDEPAVSLLSIPRDYYAWIPAWGLDKINTAYGRAGKVNYPGGGPALTRVTVEYNFGVPIHYYALVDFTSYQTIVNAVGGVDVIVECPLHDTYPDPASETGQTDIDLEPGLHHLDGKFALWYVRSRWDTSDFDRHRRQQQVLTSILHQARSANMLVRAPELWDAYKESVETDLGLGELITLASVAGRLDERSIYNTFVRGRGVITAWTAPNGGYVLVPNLEAVQELVQNAMRPLSTSRASQRGYRAVVSNGSWSQAFGEVAAYRLRLEGLEVTVVEDIPPEPRTRVVDFTTTAKGSPLHRLISLYHLQQGDVTSEPTEGSAADFRVILGANYNPCTATGTAYWHATPTPPPPP
ncbi:MAG: LCP family protein, partial [Anaerolineae bacterium]|nr:LCP family protein [Anaerolineae bacterium]